MIELSKSWAWEIGNCSFIRIVGSWVLWSVVGLFSGGQVKLRGLLIGPLSLCEGK